MQMFHYFNTVSFHYSLIQALPLPLRNSAQMEMKGMDPSGSWSGAADVGNPDSRSQPAWVGKLTGNQAWVSCEFHAQQRVCSPYVVQNGTILKNVPISPSHQNLTKYCFIRFFPLRSVHLKCFPHSEAVLLLGLYLISSLPSASPSLLKKYVTK